MMHPPFALSERPFDVVDEQGKGLYALLKILWRILFLFPRGIGASTFTRGV